MKTTLAAFSLAVSMLATHAALADDAKPNPDVVQPKPVAPPHLFLAAGAGASFSSVDVFKGGYEIHYLSAHAHLDLNVGHEVLAGNLGTDRVSLALGYAGAADFNGDEILHHHGFGVTLRKSWFYVTLDGGLAVINGFSDGFSAVGGHFGVNWGFRMGPVQLAFPISVDVFNAPCTTFAATLGFQI
jgi:hypothetical protein